MEKIKKCALVIGGGRGIGRAVAIRCARDGYYVLINYRNNTAEAQKTLDEITAAGGNGRLVQFDITDREKADKCLQQQLNECQIEALILSAGIRNDQLLVFMNQQQWDTVIDTNLKSFYTVVKPVVKEMLLSHSGRVVVISSTSGQSGLPGQVHYSASKAGLIGAVKALALECAKRNVLVNAVTPGFIDTDMTDDEDLKAKKALVPLMRFGKVEEVSGVVAFLLSNDSSYITGQVIAVNGGIYT
jgi:3-oxoacyl-[acyl-carrier protein] reductase